jgi:hypothetical protein
MADETNLLPVIVGGALSMGGIGIGLVVAVVRDWMSRKEERRNRRADKFEELVAALYEFDHWVDTARNRALGGAAAEPSVSPFAKIQAITSVYFPQFDPLVRELDRCMANYRVWIETTNFKRTSGELTELPDGLTEVMTPYNDAHDKLTQQLSSFAQKKFQN